MKIKVKFNDREQIAIDMLIKCINKWEENIPRLNNNNNKKREAKSKNC